MTTAMITPAAEKLYLKLKRSQRTTALAGKPVFILDARVEAGPGDRALIAKYRLGDLVVYDSKARRARTEEAVGHYQDAYVSSYGSVGKATWQALKGATASALAALTLRITVDGLIKGQHIECKELDELMAAEAAIREACDTLRAYLDTALTFDGRETVLEY